MALNHQIRADMILVLAGALLLVVMADADACDLCRKNPKDKREAALADVLGEFHQLGKPVYHMIGNHWRVLQHAAAGAADAAEWHGDLKSDAAGSIE